jgi:PEP-CTERM motif-containing protein
MNVRKLGFLVLLLAMVPLAAHADFEASIGPNNCSSCFGGTYTVTFIGNNAGNTFQVKLTITTPSGGVVGGEYISGVNIGFGAKITSYTPVQTSGLGTWSTVLGNLNSGGACDGPPPGNKICSQQNSNNPPFQYALANGGTYTWTWTVTLNKTGLELMQNNQLIHIGAQYQAGSGSNGHIVSEEAKIPEPATLATLGIGLFLVGLRLHRRK